MNENFCHLPSHVYFPELLMTRRNFLEAKVQCTKKHLGVKEVSHLYKIARMTSLPVFLTCSVLLTQKAQQENGRKNRAKVASQNQESIVLKQKRVANEAASVAQNRKSLIEAQMITDQNGFSNGHALKQSNGHT